MGMKVNDRDIILANVKSYGSELHIDLWYPRNSSIKSFVIGLVDVRSADSIRVSYDFERDGWKIEQASRFEWEEDDEVCDLDWQEVAFIESWSRKPE